MELLLERSDVLTGLCIHHAYKTPSVCELNFARHVDSCLQSSVMVCDTLMYTVVTASTETSSQ